VEAGHGSQVAVYYDSPVTKTARKITYAELRELVARVAGILRNHGVDKGDTVIIYMPMIPETLVAMLACARLGAVHSVVFGGFAPKELAKRIEDCQPKVIFSASCGVEPKGTIAYKVRPSPVNPAIRRLPVVVHDLLFLLVQSRCLTRPFHFRLPSPGPASSISGRNTERT